MLVLVNTFNSSTWYSKVSVKSGINTTLKTMMFIFLPSSWAICVGKGGHAPPPIICYWCIKQPRTTFIVEWTPSELTLRTRYHKFPSLYSRQAFIWRALYWREHSKPIKLPFTSSYSMIQFFTLNNSILRNLSSEHESVYKWHVLGKTWLEKWWIPIWNNSLLYIGLNIQSMHACMWVITVNISLKNVRLVWICVHLFSPTI